MESNNYIFDNPENIKDCNELHCWDCEKIVIHIMGKKPLVCYNIQKLCKFWQEVGATNGNQRN